MPPKSTNKAQTSLSNWFKSSNTAESADNNGLTDDEGEGRTLPPPSEPNSPVATEDEDEGSVAKARPTKRKSISTKESEPEEMEDDDDEPRPKNTKQKLKLVPDAKGKKARGTKNQTATTTPRQKPAKPTAGKKKAVVKKPKKTKVAGDESGDEEPEDEDEPEEEEGDNLNRSKTHADDLNLPPLSKMPAIFRDIVTRNPKLKDVAQLFQTHADGSEKTRKLRVGTMCSGTESPLLALQLISEAMELNEAMSGRTLQVEHIFSCEIEPFKQAYIERNFHPPILFRDVTELGGEEAYDFSRVFQQYLTSLQDDRIWLARSYPWEH